MKEFMVVVALLILGLFIAGIILGDSDTSIKSATKNLMNAQIGALSD